MTESTFSERSRKLLVEDWDVLVVYGFLLFMIQQSMGLSEIPRQFPLVFLVFGLVAMTIEIAVRLLPPKYGDPIRRITTGIASEMSSELTDDDDDDDGGGELSADVGSEDDVDVERTLLLSIALIVGFGILAYLFSFLLALPIFVVVSMFTLGDKSVRNTVLTVIVMFLLIYFVFGDVMNVPIDTGELVDAGDYLPLLITGGL